MDIIVIPSTDSEIEKLEKKPFLKDIAERYIPEGAQLCGIRATAVDLQEEIPTLSLEIVYELLGTLYHLNAQL